MNKSSTGNNVLCFPSALSSTHSENDHHNILAESDIYCSLLQLIIVIFVSLRLRQNRNYVCLLPLERATSVYKWLATLWHDSAQKSHSRQNRTKKKQIIDNDWKTMSIKLNHSVLSAHKQLKLFGIRAGAGALFESEAS